MSRIVYTRPDGGISIVTPVTANAVGKCVPPGTPYRIVPTSEIPTDRYFRNAWEDTGNITVNMGKAREIQMAKIRVARDAELKRLDIEQLKGIDVSAEKAKLRDLPQTFDLSQAKTPEELKALWPEGLPRG